MELQVVVVGIGQPLRGDDAVGLIAAQLWNDTSDYVKYHPSTRVEFVELTGTELVEIISDSHLAIVIDAVQSGADPGTIHILTVDDLDKFNSSSKSTHGWGIAETFALAITLDPTRLPARLVLLGVEIESLEFGSGLSPKVQAALPAVIAAIQEQLKILDHV